MRITKKILLTFSVASIIAGCSGSSDVEAWIAQQKASTPPTPQDLNLSKDGGEYTYEIYGGDGLVSPLSHDKLNTTLPPGAVPPECYLEQLNRRNNQADPLESYPIGSLTAVGYIKDKATQRAVALIRVGGDKVFDVYVGQHIGQDFGVVTSISETQVYITETIRMPENDICTSREVVLNIYGEGEQTDGHEGKSE